MPASTSHRRARILAAVATALVTVNLAGTALAATDGSTGGSTPSTTVPAGRTRDGRTGDRATRRAGLEAFKAALAEWKSEMAAYGAARREIMSDFKSAVQAAVAANEAAGKTEASKAAMRTAIAAAKSAREAAIAALGPRPERPARP